MPYKSFRGYSLRNVLTRIMHECGNCSGIRSIKQRPDGELEVEVVPGGGIENMPPQLQAVLEELGAAIYAVSLGTAQTFEEADHWKLTPSIN